TYIGDPTHNNHTYFPTRRSSDLIDSYYKGRPLGSIGHMAAFSFHETKNIISGEGGMLVINDERFVDRAEIIREKGTNRSQFFRRSEEHTSELQSRENLVCRLLLE